MLATTLRRLGHVFGPSAGRPARTVRQPPRRTVSYAPDLDGAADPGEVVWTWVPYNEDARRGKDRPVLIVSRQGRTVFGLMLSSNAKREGEPGWYRLGAGTWDPTGRPSWVRLDRTLSFGDNTIRREGSVLDAARFTQVAAQLARYGWR